MKHMAEDGYINDIKSAVEFSFFAKFHVHSSHPEKDKQEVFFWKKITFVWLEK